MGTGRIGKGRNRQHLESGSVSLELIGALPVVLVSTLIAAQIAIAGYSLWAAGLASRAGARAVLTGRGPDGAVARSLPPVLRGGLAVSGRDPVRVGVRIPRLMPLLPDTRVYASSSLGER